MRSLRLAPSTSITIGLVSLTLMLFWISDLTFGLFPDKSSITRSVRQQVSTNLASQITTLLEANDAPMLSRMLEEIRAANSEIESIAVLRSDDQYIAKSGPHSLAWKQIKPAQSTLTHVQVPILKQGLPWATIQITFRPTHSSTISRLLDDPSIYMPLGIGLVGGAFFYLYLRRVLHNLDPSQVIPERVSAAFDTLTEAVLIVDSQGRLMLTNAAFRKLHPDAEHVKMGVKVSDIKWLSSNFSGMTPWDQVNQKLPAVSRLPLKIPLADNRSRHVLVSASPVLDSAATQRGCLVIIQDVTEQEMTNARLKRVLKRLQESQEKIEAQNRELQTLANVDQLTGLLNRRAFFDQGNAMFEKCAEEMRPLTVIMCDIDHFKSINDNYGHPVGDEAIRMVSKLISNSVRSCDIVGRYGGEEFCVVVPDMLQESAQQLANRIRENIEQYAGPGVRSVDGLRITSSFGMTMFSADVKDLAAMIEQADQALYLSKENGRNRVSVFRY